MKKSNGYLTAGCIITAVLFAMILLSAFWTPYDPSAMSGAEKLLPPSLAHWMGTDNFGRDIFSRVLRGAGSTFTIAAAVVAIGAVCGTAVGALTGYFGGRVDAVLMRFNDAMTAFPSILLGLVFVSVLGPGTYNVILALGIVFIPSFTRMARSAYAACRECGVSPDTAAGVISRYILKNGRMQKFTLGAHKGVLLTSKHENSIAYDTNLRYVAASKEPCTVVVIVDAVSRKYFTSETSWLWDIDFDQLAKPHVKKVILSGRYCNDLALRFSFTGIPREKILVQPDIAAAAQTLKEDGGEQVYAVTCFSDRDKLLDLPAVKKEA